MTQSGTLTTANYHADVDGIRADLQTHLDALRGPRQSQVVVPGRSVTSSTDISLRSLIFTPYDDSDILCLLLEAATASGSHNCSAVLEAIVDAGTVQDNKLPGGANAPSVTLSGVSTSLTSDRKRYYDTDGPRPGLLAGTPYRLSVVADSGTFEVLRATLVLGKYARR